MKIRSLRPEFFADQKMVQLSPMARLLYQGLWCIADDYGRGRYMPKAIEGEVFPHEQVDIYGLLAELITMGRIVVYTAGDEQFFHIPTFDRHHKPSKRFDSRLPPPPQPTLNGNESHQQTAVNALTTDVMSNEIANTEQSHSVDVSLSHVSLTLTAQDAVERWAQLTNTKPTRFYLRRWENHAQEFLEQHPDLDAEQLDAYLSWAYNRGVQVPAGWSAFWAGWPQQQQLKPLPDCPICENRRMVPIEESNAFEPCECTT